MKVYDGKGLVLGRLAAAVAKDALLGEEIKVINCEKVIVSERKRVVFKENKERRQNLFQRIGGSCHSKN